MSESKIDVEPTGDGIAIHLPCRELGGAGKAGWIAIGLGTCIALFMVGWIATPIVWGVGIMQQGEMFGALFIAFGCLGLGGLFAAAKLMALGIALIRDRTRCSVHVESERIVSRERFGWFGHKTKIPRSNIENLFIAPVSIPNDGQGEQSGRATTNLFNSLFGVNASDWFLIKTEKRIGKLIALGYQRETLEFVASTIAEELNRSSADPVLIVRDSLGTEDRKSNAIVSVQHLSEEDIDQAEYELPENSTLQVIEEGDSTVYQIPERSLVSGSHGLFSFSVLWNGFMLVFTMLAIGGMVNGGNGGGVNGVGDFFAIGAFISLFWAVGIGMLVGAYYMARQSAMIGVKDGLLFIERKTIFGTKWTEFEADELESISMGHANMEVNEVPVMNLQIKPTDQKSVGMFGHLENQEIQWLAQQLRRSLGIETADARFAVLAFDPDAAIEEPEKTDILVRHESEATAISVPPHDFLGGKGLRISLLLFMILPTPIAIGCGFIFGFDPMFIPIAIVGTIFSSGLFLCARMLWTREFHIVATERNLEIQREGFLSNKTFFIDSQDITKVDVKDSGTKIGNDTLYCVEVKGKGGQSFTMMTGRDESELVYVARLIHQRMKSLSPTNQS